MGNEVSSAAARAVFLADDGGGVVAHVASFLDAIDMSKLTRDVFAGEAARGKCLGRFCGSWRTPRPPGSRGRVAAEFPPLRQVPPTASTRPPIGHRSSRTSERGSRTRAHPGTVSGADGTRSGTGARWRTNHLDLSTARMIVSSSPPSDLFSPLTASSSSSVGGPFQRGTSTSSGSPAVPF